MQGKSIYKVSGGKMLKINLECDQDFIKEIKINGDFFLYPEEGLDILEKEISGSSFKELNKKIEEIIKKNKLILYGFGPNDLVQAILLAKESKI